MMPSRSIMSISRPAREKPMRKRRCSMLVEAWPLWTTKRTASSNSSSRSSTSAASVARSGLPTVSS